MNNTQHIDTYINTPALPLMQHAPAPIPPAPAPTPNPNPNDHKEEHPSMDTAQATTPTPTPHPYADTMSAILDAVLTLMTPHIERMVQKKFEDLVDHTNVLSKLDADIEQKMRDIAEEVASEAVYQHEQAEDHYDSDYITDKVTDAVNDAGLTERQVETMISDAIDAHCSEMEHKDEDDVETIVSDFTENNDFLTKDNLGDYLIDALKEALPNMTVTINPSN